MKIVTEYVVGATIAVGWLAGVVLSTGQWWWVSMFFPPYAWYLVVERLIQLIGMI